MAHADRRLAAILSADVAGYSRLMGDDEQPLPRDDIAGLAEIRRAVRTPVMADESVQDETALMEIIRLEPPP